MATGFEERPIATENLVSIHKMREEIQASALDTRQDYATNEKNFSVGFYDIDESLQYYFDNVLKPTVEENGEQVSVPVIYGSPERWKIMEQNGIFRDAKSKLILPLIMYRKTNIARWDQLYWPRLDQLYFVSKRRWSKKKMYSDFEIRTQKQGAEETWETDNHTLTSIPNYVILNYEGVIWTSYLEHANSLMEKIIFSEGTYWGDPEKFKFRTEVDGFDTAVDISTDTQRMVRVNFSMTCYGYILPESFDSKLTSRIAFGPKRVVFGTEIIGESTKKIIEHNPPLVHYDPPLPPEPEPEVPAESFIVTLNITSPATSITLPLSVGYVSDFTVDYGDGTDALSVATFDDANATHEYADIGSYDITINGTMESWYVDNDSAIDTKITEVKSWGASGVLKQLNFKGCSNLTALPDETGKLSIVEDFNESFWLCAALTAIPTGLFDDNITVTSFYFTFAECLTLISIPSGLFDDNINATNFESTFNSCNILPTIPSGLFDNIGNTTSTNFQETFMYCQQLSYLPTLWISHNLVTSHFNTFASSVGASNYAAAETAGYT